MGPLGMQEMIAIFVIALVLFGPKKLPELGRTLGKALTEFRRAKNELKSTFESHMQELERETRIDTYDYNQSGRSGFKPHSPAPYSYPYDEYGNYDQAPESSAQPVHDVSASDTRQLSSAGAPDGDTVVNQSQPSSPVTGTVARSNGVHAVEPVTPTAPEEHPA